MGRAHTNRVRTLGQHIQRSANFTLEDATAAMLRQGFVEYDRGDGYAVVKKPGTQFSTQSEKFALEAALAQQGADVELQILYDSFVLFDTGDLEADSGPHRRGLHPVAGARGAHISSGAPNQSTTPRMTTAQRHPTGPIEGHALSVRKCGPTTG